MIHSHMHTTQTHTHLHTMIFSQFHMQIQLSSTCPLTTTRHHVTHFVFSHLASSSGVLEASANRITQYLVDGERHCHPNPGSDGVPVKMAEVVDVIMSEGVEVNRSFGGMRDDKTGGETKEDGGEVSPLEALGDLYAMDASIKQMSYGSDRNYADLDVYLHDLRAKLTTTFLELLENKHCMNFWVAVHVRYTYPTKDLGNSDTILLHSGMNSGPGPLVLDRQLGSLIETLRERHIYFNRNLSGLVLDEILET